MTRMILWDWDGTLVDSFETIRQAYNAARTAFDLPPWTLEETHQNVAKSGRDTFPAMFGDNAAAAERIFYETYNDLAPTTVKPKQGREVLLKALHVAGIPQGVVSNKRGDILRKECAALGWHDFFIALVGAGDATADKPDAAPVKLAISQMGMPLSGKSVYIGDGPIDAHTAQSVDIQAILLEGETHTKTALEAETGNVRVVKFEELTHLLFQER